MHTLVFISMRSTDKFNMIYYLINLRSYLFLRLVLPMALVDFIFVVQSECFVKCYDKNGFNFLIQKLLEVHSAAHCFKSNQGFKILKGNRTTF